MIKQILKKRNISVYKCSKLSGIPYTTLHELITSKSKFENCSIKTINKLATTLNIPISELIESELEYRMPFEEFKSELCHRLKMLGQINFIKNILLNDSISNYYNKGWYAEALYSLACLDYISKLNNIPLAKEYNAYRNKKLKKTIFPRDTILISKLTKNENEKNNIIKRAIPEFLKYNIIEININNVQ